MKSANALALHSSSENQTSQTQLGDRQQASRPRRSITDWQNDVMTNLNKMSQDPAYRKEIAKRQS